MERTVRVLATFAEADAEDLRQWLELSRHERFMLGEQMRWEASTPDQRRLQRVLRLVEREES